jgi:hypothetical protein
MRKKAESILGRNAMEVRLPSKPFYTLEMEADYAEGWQLSVYTTANIGAHLTVS